MLPRANRQRSRRDVDKLKLSSRSAEIQRLIGRSLRAAVDMKLLGERTITIDCDVLQGDGGTRTASVTGGFVALALACRWLVEEGYIGRMPIRHYVAGVSAGIVDDTAVLDLPYNEDSRAQVDLNCVMNELGEIIEIQGTGEGRSFSVTEQQELVALCAASAATDCPSGTGVLPGARVMITVWLTSGSVYSVFKEAAAPQKELTPGHTSYRIPSASSLSNCSRTAP